MTGNIETWVATNWFSLLQTVSIVTGLVVIAKQQRDGIRQREKEIIKREAESLDKVLDVNQQLVILALSHPQLFAVLRDAPGADADMEQCYLQLWLNQYSRVHLYLKHKIFRDEQVENLERDICRFMQMHNMQRHWRRFGQYYPESFQKYINGILKKNEPPVAAHLDTDSDSCGHQDAST